MESDPKGSSAKELFQAGHLQKALDAQIAEVKRNPADQSARIFLFELAAFAGDLDRAQRQIEAVKYGDMERDSRVQSYRKVLDSERLRRRLFSEGLAPKFLAPPPESAQWRLDAINCLRGGQVKEAGDLLRRADEATPALKGKLNGKAFDVLRDCDDVFGPILEVLHRGEYYWLPLEQVESVVVRGLESARDYLWLPGKVSMRDGPSGDVLLPAIYPGSHEHPDEAIKLGRATDWSSADKGPVRGVGRREFLCGDDAASILEWRKLELE